MSLYSKSFEPLPPLNSGVPEVVSAEGIEKGAPLDSKHIVQSHNQAKYRRTLAEVNQNAVSSDEVAEAAKREFCILKEHSMGNEELGTPRWAQALQDSMRQVQQDVSTMKQDITTMKQDITSTKQDITSMKQDINANSANISTIENVLTGMEIENYNKKAKESNDHNDEFICPFKNVDGNLPASFPNTRTALENLPIQDISDLLQHYNLPTTRRASKAMRLTALKKHLKLY